MRDIFALLVHVIVTAIRLARPGGLRSVIAESTLVRHQLSILNRGRKRAPNLRVSDRIVERLIGWAMITRTVFGLIRSWRAIWFRPIPSWCSRNTALRL